MKNVKKVLLVMLVAVMGLAIISCDNGEKNEPTPVIKKPILKKAVNNPELVAKLTALGFEVEGNTLVINDKVEKATSLDLSGAGIANLEGLELFPNLVEVNLANNKFVDVFDFAELPEKITSVDLSDNKLYEFKGLATVDVANANVTVLRKFDKLVLPSTAKFNVETLPFYFKEGAVADMQMQNEEGKAEKYTTLREIPDEKLREFMKTIFPSRFNGDKLDIATQFGLSERTAKFNVGTEGGFWCPESLDGVEFSTIEGVEYIINDPRFAGEFWAWPAKGQKYTTNYIKIGENLEVFTTRNIATPVIDFSNAKKLRLFATEFNNGLKKADFSASEAMGQREFKSIQFFLGGDEVIIANCDNLEEIILPEKATIFNQLFLAALPKLNQIDLSRIKGFSVLQLGGIPNATIKYPKVDKDFKYVDQHNEKGFAENVKKNTSIIFYFNIDKDVFNKAGTVDFIMGHYDNLDKDYYFYDRGNATDADIYSPVDRKFGHAFSGDNNGKYNVNGKIVKLYDWITKLELRNIRGKVPFHELD